MKFLRTPVPAVVRAAGALLALFVVLGGVAWAVKSGETKSPSVRNSITLTFSADGADHELFKIGRSTVIAVCNAIPSNSPENPGGIGTGLGLIPGPDGATLVNSGVPGAGEGTGGALVLGPGQNAGFLEFGADAGAVNGGEASFAIFDGGGTSASGTAAILADDPNERCVVTVQVAG